MVTASNDSQTTPNDSQRFSTILDDPRRFPPIVDKGGPGNLQNKFNSRQKVHCQSRGGTRSYLFSQDHLTHFFLWRTLPLNLLPGIPSLKQSSEPRERIELQNRLAIPLDLMEFRVEFCLAAPIAITRVAVTPVTVHIFDGCWSREQAACF